MDFSKLTDDQLVELVRNLCFEAAQRGWAVQQAAQAAMLSEAEKARIAAAAAAREAERLREAEAQRIADEAAAKVRREVEAARNQAETETRRQKEQRRAALAEAVYEIVGKKHCTISVWSPRDQPHTDRRVYFDEGDGFVRRGWKICVHVDGSSKVRPGTVEGVKGAEAEALRAVAELVLDWLRVKLCTKVYIERADLDRGGAYRAEYQSILDAYRVARAEEERVLAEARAAWLAEEERKKREAEATRAARLAEERRKKCEEEARLLG